MKLRAIVQSPCLSSLGKNGVAPSAPNASTKMAARRLAKGSGDWIPKVRESENTSDTLFMAGHECKCYYSYMQVTSSDIQTSWMSCLAIRLAEGQLSSLRRGHNIARCDKDIKSSNRILASCNGKEKER